MQLECVSGHLNHSVCKVTVIERWGPDGLFRKIGAGDWHRVETFGLPPPIVMRSTVFDEEAAEEAAPRMPARKSVNIPPDIQAMSLERITREYQAYEQPEAKQGFEILVRSRDAAQQRLTDWTDRKHAVVAHYAAMLAESIKPQRTPRKPKQEPQQSER